MVARQEYAPNDATTPKERFSLGAVWAGFSDWP